MKKIPATKKPKKTTKATTLKKITKADLAKVAGGTGRRDG